MLGIVRDFEKEEKNIEKEGGEGGGDEKWEKDKQQQTFFLIQVIENALIKH